MPRYVWSPQRFQSPTIRHAGLPAMNRSQAHKLKCTMCSTCKTTFDYKKNKKVLHGKMLEVERRACIKSKPERSSNLSHFLSVSQHPFHGAAT
jgi:hypothetical protein